MISASGPRTFAKSFLRRARIISLVGSFLSATTLRKPSLKQSHIRTIVAHRETFCRFQPPKFLGGVSVANPLNELGMGQTAIVDYARSARGFVRSIKSLSSESKPRTANHVT